MDLTPLDAIEDLRGPRASVVTGLRSPRQKSIPCIIPMRIAVHPHPLDRTADLKSSGRQI